MIIPRHPLLFAALVLLVTSAPVSAQEPGESPSAATSEEKSQPWTMEEARAFLQYNIENTHVIDWEQASQELERKLPAAMAVESILALTSDEASEIHSWEKQKAVTAIARAHPGVVMQWTSSPEMLEYQYRSGRRTFEWVLEGIAVAEPGLLLEWITQDIPSPPEIKILRQRGIIRGALAKHNPKALLLHYRASDNLARNPQILAGSLLPTAEQDPLWTAEFLQGFEDLNSIDGEILQAVLLNIGEKHPEKGWSLALQITLPELQNKVMTDILESCKNLDLRMRLIKDLPLGKDYESAVFDLAHSLGNAWESQPAAAESRVREWFQDLPKGIAQRTALEGFIGIVPAPVVLDLIQDLDDKNARQTVFSSFFYQCFTNALELPDQPNAETDGPTNTATEARELSPEFREQWIQRAVYLMSSLPTGEFQDFALNGIAEHYAEAMPRDVFELVLANQAGPGSHEALRTSVSVWLDQNPEEALPRISQLPEGEMRDVVADELIPQLWHNDRPEALKWVESYSEPERRRVMIYQGLRSWLLEDPNAAVAWIHNNTQLDPQLKKHLINPGTVDPPAEYAPLAEVFAE